MKQLSYDVVGLLFSEDLSKVLLIKEYSTLYNDILYNGVRSTVNISEYPLVTLMSNVFKEKTNLSISSWSKFLSITSRDHITSYFYSIDDNVLNVIPTSNIKVIKLSNICTLSLDPDLLWIYNLCLKCIQTKEIFNITKTI